MGLNINVDKVPDADVIAKRIFGVMNLGDIEREMITKILSEWSEEWIGLIAEERTGLSENTKLDDKRRNSERLKKRMDRLGKAVGETPTDNPGF